ncbi:hypothetical protein IJI94_02590 [Candidatus Saccharibacteria bacterium]|nr:hypothetical protein [Candidatus Saccharibacteria bacterium]
METAPAKPADKFTKEEKESGKGMSVLAYIGILSLIPFFAEKKNKFVVYHAKQGINLFLCEVIVGVGIGIISGIISGIAAASLNLFLLFTILPIIGVIGWACSIFFLVMSIMGIVQACSGEAKKLPVVGKIKIVK